MRIRVNEDINSYFHSVKRELIGRLKLDWGMCLEGYMPEAINNEGAAA